MRRVETAIRRQKDTANLARATGDDKLRLRCQGAIMQLNQKYEALANKARLQPEFQRTNVSEGNNGKNGTPPVPGAADAVRNTSKPVRYSERATYSIRTPGQTEEYNNGLSDAMRDLAIKGTEAGFEHMYLLDLKTGEKRHYETNGEPDFVGFDFREYLKDHPGESFAFVHNHNTDRSFSEQDMNTLLTEPQIPVMVAVRNDGILEILRTIIDDTKEDGSFYVFYDRLQMVQARRMPKFLEDADCKLTLYRNCRNTENIAKTSLRPITERNPKLMESCIVGVPARLHYCGNEDLVLAAVDDALDALIRDGISDIVILTCKTEAESLLAPHLEKGMYPAGKKHIPFTTCRKFKGLEADTVILADIDEDTFLGNDGQNVLLYYVGTSRARLRLDMITTIDQEGCTRVLEGMGKEKPGKKPFKALASTLNALPLVELL